MNKTKKETLTRADIEKSLKKELPNLSKLEKIEAIEAILESIVEAVALDETGEIRGFGSLSKKFVSQRKLVNPKTQENKYI